jgi:RHS repeat-associated protein
VEGKCSYSAYGTPTCEGTGRSPLGYDGQYANSDTGLIYLRARVYDPATAQFMSVDPLASLTGERYMYTEDNPLNADDRTGLFSLGERPVIGGPLQKVVTRVVGWADGFTRPVFGGFAALRSTLEWNLGTDQCSQEYQIASKVGGYTLDAEAVAPLAYAGGTGAGVILGSVGSEGATEATGNLLTDLATALPDAEIGKLRAAALTLGGTGSSDMRRSGGCKRYRPVSLVRLRAAAHEMNQKLDAVIRRVLFGPYSKAGASSDLEKYLLLRRYCALWFIPLAILFVLGLAFGAPTLVWILFGVVAALWLWTVVKLPFDLRRERRRAANGRDT